MKYLIGIVSILALTACGGNGGNDKTAATTDTAASPTNPPAGSMPNAAATEHTAHPGYALMQSQDCKTCHAVDKQVTGPSFQMIAAHYDSTQAGVVERLAKKVISGGSGNWGTVPMTPHPALSEQDAEELVRYILSYK
jgi:cytochrome c